MNYSEMLGLYFGEPLMVDWLKELGIKDEPALPRGEDNAWLSKKSAGIELTFSDSESLELPEREYPNGALVLKNIRFYGVKTNNFALFMGLLPLGITFG